MKKLYLLGLLVIMASATGCTLKAPTVPTLPADDVQEITGTVENTWTLDDAWIPIIWSNAMEEFTGEFDSGVVPTVEGSAWVNVNSWVTAEVKTLIDERNTQSGDEGKLTEEDIGLMEQIIQKIQDIGK